MANPKQFCPECGLQTLRCVQTVATGVEGHPLESPRLSVWECQNLQCSARFQLDTPEGRLRKVRRNFLHV